MIIFAVGTMFFMGLADFFYKRAQAKGVATASFMFVVALFYVALAAGTALPKGGIRLAPVVLLYGPLCGLTSFWAIFLFMRSLDKGEASTLTTIYRLNFIFPAILGIIFLAEELRWSKLIGLLAASGAIGSLALSPGQAQGGPTPPRAILLALSSMFLYGATGFIFKLAAGANVPTASLVVFQGTTFSLLALGISLTREGFTMSVPVLIYGPLIGVLQSVANLLLVFALRRGEVSILVPISQLSFVVTATITIAAFKESLTLRKVAGLLLAVSAVFLMSRRAG